MTADQRSFKCVLFLVVGNIVVHFMLPEAREKYQIEKLWTLGEFDDMTIEIKEYNEVQEL